MVKSLVSFFLTHGVYVTTITTSGYTCAITSYTLCTLLCHMMLVALK